MKRILSAIALLSLTALTCVIPFRDQFFGDPGDVPLSVRETQNAFVTQTAEAEVAAAAQEEALVEEEPPATSGDFCEVYTEYVNDVKTRIDEYENVVGGGGDGDALALALDQSIESYMDRLAPIAPEEISVEVELLANTSLIGLFSSQESFPQAEMQLFAIDEYASDNCNISLND